MRYCHWTWPGAPASEHQRWDYRVVIVYRNQLVPAQEQEIERQLFPDRASYKREENRRWELVDAHWDLPIHEVDPHASDQYGLLSHCARMGTSAGSDARRPPPKCVDRCQ